MNYQQHYDALVLRVRNRLEIPDPNERHHVIPKSLGGTNDLSNLIFLTPKEHYVAHHLLWKIYRNKEMHFAFWLMATKCSNSEYQRNYNVNSRTYQLLKEQHVIEVSKIHKGKTRSEESKKKGSISLKGKKSWCKGLTGIHSEEGLKSISRAQRGRKDSDEARLKKSISHTGVSRGPSPLKGVPAKPFDKRYIITCPHCNRSGTEWNMKRYHFDFCKLQEKENLY